MCCSTLPAYSAFPAKKKHSRTAPTLPITEHLALLSAERSVSCTVFVYTGGAVRSNLLPTCAKRHGRLMVLRFPQTGAKYSQRWRRRQYRPSFAWTATKRFAWLFTPTRQFCGSVCDNVLIRRRRGTFISCLRRWRKFQVCISIRPL